MNLIRLFLVVLSSTGLACAADEPATKDPAPKTETVDETPRVEATSLQDLRTRVGETIVVTGDVDRVGKSSGGHRFLNFAGNGELTVFISSDDVEKFQDGTPETLFEGKSVAVRGKLERFRGKLQIAVGDPKQIVLLETKRGPPEGARPEPVTLKEAGSNVWISPAGLRYAGRDPEGLTRKAHVLRHAKDIPNRDGPHGVFDGGEGLTFAWIDAAWERIRERKLKPNVEGDRETYTVSMGRVSGRTDGGGAWESAADADFSCGSKRDDGGRDGVSEVVATVGECQMTSFQCQIW